MYLKRLEIQGFKSFADKTVLEFQPGIVLIVGPNGSGKSNVADAIRWVLGEQSVKSLRGGKMEDVIFAGSDQRRSLGMAEVSLTIDNTSGIFPLDFQEVTVTRRLYRSGESDYLINRVPCRLRDVHELFMDTGVGREGFSIIGQGRIEEILTVKAEERRGIIEEAAGIVRYRHRKKEAERKLAETETSLVRLEDIISELSLQEEPLAEQAKVAQIYRDLKEELDTLEIGLLLDDIQGTESRLNNFSKNFLLSQEEIEELRTGYHQAQTKEEELRFRLQQKEDDIAYCQDQIYNENITLEKNESEKRLTRERITDLAKQKKAYRHDLVQLQEEFLGLEKETELQKKQEETYETKKQESKEKLQSYEQLVREENEQDRELAEQLENLKNEHFEGLQNETQLKNDLQRINQSQEQIKRQEENLKNRTLEIQSEMDSVKKTLQGLAAEDLHLKEEGKKLEKKLSELTEQLTLEQSILKEVEQTNRALAEEKSGVMARHKVIAEMEKEGQGYTQGVRELLRQKEDFPGVIGTVAQVLSVDKPYEVAVEVVLGAALQNVITTDEKTAQDAIHWLKKHEKGRVTFLPLTTVKGKRPEGHVPGGSGVIGRLSELLDYDAKFKGIMEYLLGRIWLVTDLATAVKVAKETHFHYRIVTLEGEMVHPGGSLTGGSYKKQSGGILGRKRVLEELSDQIESLEISLQKGVKEEAHLKEKINGLLEEFENTKQRIREIQIKQMENTKVLERWQAESERLVKENSDLKWRLEELGTEKEEFTQNTLAIDKEIKSQKDRIAFMANEIQRLQERLRTSHVDKLKKNEKLTQLRIEVATVEEKIIAFQKEQSYLAHRMKQVLKQQEDKEQEIALIKEKTAEREEFCKTLDKEKEQQLSRIKQLEKDLIRLKGDKENLLKSIEQITHQAKAISEDLRAKEEKLHQFELQRSRYETALEGMLTRLEEQFAFSFSEAKEAYPNPVGERKGATERIIQIKDEILILGPVNHSAIEEYARLLERLSFLKEQVEDMYQAKERLQEVIGEMDQIMTKRFQETFTLVNQSFQDMFQRLFGGGRGQLMLTQPEDLLATGVEIIAQPPGKKTQYLSLLSGGEKALTAIALLMAILKIKPSPFCVLDEIESNLDETNVTRFAKLLEEFSLKTQFVVISHHKGTMEAAHLLYGITIEESGVSRLVSVRLEDIDQEAS